MFTEYAKVVSLTSENEVAEESAVSEDGLNEEYIPEALPVTEHTFEVCEGFALESLGALVTGDMSVADAVIESITRKVESINSVEAIDAYANTFSAVLESFNGPIKKMKEAHKEGNIGTKGYAETMKKETSKLAFVKNMLGIGKKDSCSMDDVKSCSAALNKISGIIKNKRAELYAKATEAKAEDIPAKGDVKDDRTMKPVDDHILTKKEFALAISIAQDFAKREEKGEKVPALGDDLKWADVVNGIHKGHYTVKALANLAGGKIFGEDKDGKLVLASQEAEEAYKRANGAKIMTAEDEKKENEKKKEKAEEAFTEFLSDLEVAEEGLKDLWDTVSKAVAGKFVRIWLKGAYISEDGTFAHAESKGSYSNAKKYTTEALNNVKKFKNELMSLRDKISEDLKDQYNFYMKGAETAENLLTKGIAKLGDDPRKVDEIKKNITAGDPFVMFFGPKDIETQMVGIKGILNLFTDKKVATESAESGDTSFECIQKGIVESLEAAKNKYFDGDTCTNGKEAQETLKEALKKLDEATGAIAAVACPDTKTAGLEWILNQRKNILAALKVAEDAQVSEATEDLDDDDDDDFSEIDAALEAIEAEDKAKNSSDQTKTKAIVANSLKIAIDKYRAKDYNGARTTLITADNALKDITAESIKESFKSRIQRLRKQIETAASSGTESVEAPGYVEAEASYEEETPIEDVGAEEKEDDDTAEESLTEISSDEMIACESAMRDKKHPWVINYKALLVQINAGKKAAAVEIRKRKYEEARTSLESSADACREIKKMIATLSKNEYAEFSKKEEVTDSIFDKFKASMSKKVEKHLANIEAQREKINKRTERKAKREADVASEPAEESFVDSAFRDYMATFGLTEDGQALDVEEAAIESYLAEEYEAKDADSDLELALYEAEFEENNK